MEHERWYPTNHDEYEQLVGREVYTKDGERLGRVDGVIHPVAEKEDSHRGHQFAVRPEITDGPLGTDVTYVPETAVADVTLDAVQLAVNADQIASQDWARLSADFKGQASPSTDDRPSPRETTWYGGNDRAAE